MDLVGIGRAARYGDFLGGSNRARRLAVVRPPSAAFGPLSNAFLHGGVGMKSYLGFGKEPAILVHGPLGLVYALGNLDRRRPEFPLGDQTGDVAIAKLARVRLR